MWVLLTPFEAIEDYRKKVIFQKQSLILIALCWNPGKDEIFSREELKLFDENRLSTAGLWS